jgi:hypothetical protein
MGSVIGALGMKWYMEHKHNEFLEQEAQWCENVANEVANKTFERYEEELKPIDDVERKILVMNKDRYEKVARNYNKTVDAVETPAIEVISFETFCERYNNNDKITLMYHYNDVGAVLADDGDVISDVVGLVGDALNHFGEGSGDPELVYVRNNRLGVDYEIVRTGEPYEPKEGDE